MHYRIVARLYLTLNLIGGLALLGAQNSYADAQCEDICKSFMRNPDGTYSFESWSTQSKVLCTEMGISTPGSDGISVPSSASDLVSVTEPSANLDGSPIQLCQIPAGVLPALYNYAYGNPSTGGSGGNTGAVAPGLSNRDACQWYSRMQASCKLHAADPNSQLINACQNYFAIEGTQDHASNDNKCMYQATGTYGSLRDPASSSGYATLKGSTSPLTSGNSGCNAKAPGILFMNPLQTEQALLALDSLGTTLCTSACLYPNPTTLALCSGETTVSTSLEIYAVIQMNNSDSGVASYIQDGLAGLGVISSSVTGVQMTKSFKNHFNETPARGLNEGKGYNAAACTTAMVMAALTGIRAYDYIQLKNSANNACKIVKSLASNSPAFSTDSSSSSSSSSNGVRSATIPSVSGIQNGNTVGLTTSGSLLSTHPLDQCMALQVSSGASSTAAGNTCANSGGLSSLGATDSGDRGLLRQMGPGDLLSHLPNTIDDLARGIAAQGAGNVLAGMMPQGAGEVGAAIADIARTAQEEAPHLGMQHRPTNSAYSGCGAGGSKSGDGGGGDALTSLFGNGMGKKGRDIASTTELLTFGGGEAGMKDIWHTDSPLSLFEIVSNKIMKVSFRVKH